MDLVIWSHSVTERDRNALFDSVTLYPLKGDSDRMTKSTEIAVTVVVTELGRLNDP